MRQIVKTTHFAVALSLAAALVAPVAAPVAAQDFEVGIAAYRHGDYAAALSEWRPLAERGDAKAQTKLGYMYEVGEGVALDYGAAAKWFRKAADQGRADAQLELGNIYFSGRGVAMDHIQAHMWWSLAADQGNQAATQGRDIVAGMMTRAQIAEAQKLARARRPI